MQADKGRPLIMLRRRKARLPAQPATRAPPMPLIAVAPEVTIEHRISVHDQQGFFDFYRTEVQVLPQLGAM
ncbi:hypothetical protein [Streptomyces sp. NPDC055134]